MGCNPLQRVAVVAGGSYGFLVCLLPCNESCRLHVMTNRELVSAGNFCFFRYMHDDTGAALLARPCIYPGQSSTGV